NAAGQDGIFGTADDVKYYDLKLSESGAGSYTFTVYVDPPPATVSFNFDQLASGSSFFGTVGTTPDALPVIPPKPQIDPNPNRQSSPDGVLKASQGGHGATIGVNSQMFDPGEGAYFTYITGPSLIGLSDNANNIAYTGTETATSASARISQTQSGSLATMKITAYDIGDAPQGPAFVTSLPLGANPPGGTQVAITSVKVFDAAHNDVTGTKVSITGGVATVSGLDSGFTIQWTTSAPHDRVLINGVAGKFDVGRFDITHAQPTPDQKLDFVARATDGDGDFKTASFSIGIDGTGSFDDGHVTGVG